MDPFAGMGQLPPVPTTLPQTQRSGNPYTFANASRPAWQNTRLTQAPMPGPTLTAPPRTLGQMVQDKVASTVAPVTGQGFANNLAGLVDYTPVGALTQAFQFGQDLRHSNVGGAVTNGIGTALNVVPDGAVAGPLLHSIIAPLFHGSPHAFEKFALDKIGTGEGAQAYGHGLYFAENPAVAKEYQQNISGNAVRLQNGDLLSANAMPFATPEDQAKRWAIQLLADHGSIAAAKARSRGSANVIRELDALGKAGAAPAGSGHLYQVSLDANPEDFLDWDKPLGQQSDKVRQLLPNLVHPEVSQLRGSQIASGSLSGPGVYHAPLGMSPQASSLPASDAWLQAGVPGLRYLDQGSRGAGNGTSNYVVFDPSIIDIKHRY